MGVGRETSAVVELQALQLAAGSVERAVKDWIVSAVPGLLGHAQWSRWFPGDAP